jgi:NhaA family Na+:H+ antiporter
VEVRIGPLQLAKPLLLWINDGLMAVFFLLVGLEIKRELVVGQLASWRDRALPGFAALGGMIVPALVYVAFNYDNAAAVRGWAIPAATDIAFSLGVLALLGSRVPLSLKVFLTALAILDDLGAVIIIAIFYTADLSPMMIGLAALTVGALVAMNASRVTVLWPYLILGVLLWYFVFESGVHATIAGVLLAATIPVQGSSTAASESSPLYTLEHALAPWVAFIVLPIFGFANAGVALGGIGLQAIYHPVTLGSALGLFVGKQIGVFAGAWLTVRAGWAARPAGSTWAQVYAVAILCGIGFTMSLFIGLLAFTTDEFHDATKIGVLAGSVLSALVGWTILRFLPKAR